MAWCIIVGNDDDFAIPQGKGIFVEPLRIGATAIGRCQQVETRQTFRVFFAFDNPDRFGFVGGRNSGNRYSTRGTPSRLLTQLPLPSGLRWMEDFFCPSKPGSRRTA